MASPEQITVALSLDPEANPNGAGWLLPNGDVVTCSHVVAGSSGKIWVRAIHADSVARQYARWETEPLAKSEKALGLYEGDLALLKPATDADRLRPGRTYVGGMLRPGTETTAFGFPDGWPAGRSGEGSVGATTLVGRFELLEAESDKRILVQGFSGAPILDVVRKRVLGLFASTVEQQGLGYVIPLRQIGAWLRSIGEEAGYADDGAPAKSPGLAAILGAVYGERPPDPEDMYDLRVREVLGEKRCVAEERPARSYARDDLAPDAFVALAVKSDRPILLRSPGGGGKSSYLVQLVESLESAEQPYLWLDLKKFGSDRPARGSTDLSEQLRTADPAAMSEVCKLATRTVGWKGLIEGGGHLLVIVDGLNEIGQDADDLLATLSAWYFQRGNVQLLATARSTTRLASDESFRKFRVSPICKDVIATIVGTDISGWEDDLLSLLSKPQMLAISTAIGAYDARGQSEMFLRYFEEIRRRLEAREGDASISPQAVRRLVSVLSRMSYEMLRNSSPALAVPEDVWESRFREADKWVLERHATAGEAAADIKAITQELVEQGVLVRSADEGPATLGFQHSLYLEWLAVRHFVSLPNYAWTQDGFMAISLEDSSDDGLRLALELVDDPDVELFLLAMYDWRWQRTLGFVTSGTSAVSDELRDAFIGINALRLLDPFQHTRAAAEEPLQAMAGAGSDFARALIEMAKSKTAEDLLGLVRERFVGRKFQGSAEETLTRWSNLFQLPAPAGLGGVLALVSNNTFVGWSASNILRLTGVTAEALQAMRIAFLASTVTAGSLSQEDVSPKFDPKDAGVGLRWRIVHTLGRALGADQLSEGVKLLFNIWRGPDHPDIRFGACRSLMEIALAHPSQREAIFAGVSTTLRNWREAPRDNAKWRASTRKASEQLWRAWRPADGLLDEQQAKTWNLSWRSVLEQVRETAVELEWPVDGIDLALEQIQPDSEKGAADGG